MAAAEVRAVLAGLRSDSAGERVAAAERAVALTDLNQVPPDEELSASAVRYHEAATALVAAGVCTPLAQMLRPGASKQAEQQAACSALRAVFNVLYMLLSSDERVVVNGARWTNVAADIAPGARGAHWPRHSAQARRLAA